MQSNHATYTFGSGVASTPGFDDLHDDDDLPARVIIGGSSPVTQPAMPAAIRKAEPPLRSVARQSHQHVDGKPLKRPPSQRIKMPAMSTDQRRRRRKRLRRKQNA